jgi:hypothetical protein
MVIHVFESKIQTLDSLYKIVISAETANTRFQKKPLESPRGFLFESYAGGGVPIAEGKALRRLSSKTLVVEFVQFTTMSIRFVGSGSEISLVEIERANFP